MTFLCCSRSTRSLPISPDIAPTQARFPKKSSDTSQEDAVPGVRDDRGPATRDNHKSHALFSDPLLPGQMPDLSRGAALAYITEAVKKGVPLLEDTLCGSGNSGSRLASGASADRLLATLAATLGLDIPRELRSTASTFDADYHGGELLTPPASISDVVGRRSCSDTTPPPASPHPTSFLRAPCTAADVQRWSHVLDPPLRLAVSRISGDKRLYKLCPVTVPSVCGPGSKTAVGPAPAQLQPPAALPAVESSASGGGAQHAAQHMPQGQKAACDDDETQPYLELALQRLRRELHLAADLPRCPGLLQPYRVYVHPSAVHIVYDCLGDFVDMLTYLGRCQRLPESSCRSVMRQILKALATLHAENWLHRNVSAETVWVAEEAGEAPEEEGRGSNSGTAVMSRPVTEPACPQRGCAPDGKALDTEALKADSAQTAAGTTAPPQCTPESAGPLFALQLGISSGTASKERASPHQQQQQHFQQQETRKDATSPGGGAMECASPDGAAGQERASPHGAGGKARPLPEQQQQGRGLAMRSEKVLPPRLRVRLGGLEHAARQPAASASAADAAPAQKPLPLLRELVGNAYHLAPEAISGVGYGCPADVWAAGVLLFMLLTGRPPFSGRNELEVMTRVLLTAAESGYCPQPPPCNGNGSLTHAAAESGTASPSPGAAEAAARAESGTRTVGGGSGGGGGDPASVMSQARQQSGAGATGSLRALVTDWSNLSSSGGGDGKGRCGVDSMPASQRQLLRPRLAEPVEQLVVQAVLESCASAACREALAFMLAADPSKRLGAAELLRLPWFTAAGGEEE